MMNSLLYIAQSEVLNTSTSLNIFLFNNIRTDSCKASLMMSSFIPIFRLKYSRHLHGSDNMIIDFVVVIEPKKKKSATDN